MVFSTRSYFDMLISKLSDTQSSFVRAIMSKDSISAKKLAYELYKEYPQYLAFFCYIHLKDHKQILLAVLKKIKHVDPQLVYCLAKSDATSYLELRSFLSKFSGPSFIECCIRKAVMLRRAEESSKLAGKMSSNTEINAEMEIRKEDLDRLISEIDDFALYDLAIKQKIEIEFQPGMNYQWYLAARDKSLDSAIRILESSTSFQEIQRLVQNFSDSPEKLSKILESSSIYEVLIKYLEKGYSRDLLQKAWSNFSTENTHLSLKTLLALLIASKEEKNLVLSFYLSHKHASGDNYEIDLIHLFLNRYFMFHANIAKIFEKLEIKNVQQHNLAYIWSDPMILSSLRLGNSISSFKAEIKEQMRSIETNLRRFIDSNRIAGAASLLSLREKLVNSMIVSEIESCKILCTEPKTMFSGLLGDGCSYVFDKITVYDVRAETGSISSIRSSSTGSLNSDIFDNDMLPINDKEFIGSFVKMNSNKCKR